ncbi:MAG: fatty-acid oxidation protein subunit alpha [Saprospiraceae bacterium]|nr:fatty-acid oxidation protein subunit alpha [Saprospiraceae bacterium]
MARDLYHQQVRNALVKDNWRITADPYQITVEEVDFEIDLAAEPLIAADKDGEKIAIEIKSFAGPSTVNELHKAVGQFTDYYVALEILEPDRVLYLALPQHIYDTYFQKVLIQKILAKIGAKILVYDPQTEIIIRWIK